MDFIFVDKPSGVTTHTSRHQDEKDRHLLDPDDGWAEYLSARFSQKLFVSHRLDRETSGALCFATTAPSAERLRVGFAARTVKKSYFFVTDRATPQISKTDGVLTLESWIERERDGFTSTTHRNESNARTHLHLIRSEGRFALWKAEPETGKPHQIRLHARDLGIPILGDTLYGGSNFPALCLHSHELALNLGGEGDHFVSPPPVYFEDLRLLENPDLCQWLKAVDRRDRLLRSWQAFGDAAQSQTTSTLRWIHRDGDPLRMEKLGNVWSLLWFADSLPSEKEESDIRELAKRLKMDNWYLQVRDSGDRGLSAKDGVIIREGNVPPRWTASENGLQFEFRLDTGLSPGLFLDQRRNRKWVQEISNDKSVLNLFCYSGGFSVAAAAGGASKVVSVDLSKTFLEWAKRNFQLNDLPIDAHEFRAMDAREYLAWARKKGLRFDLVICDPPSFSRSKSGVFRIEKEIESLWTDLLSVTAPQTGRILFATNYEGWSNEAFCERAVHWSKKNHLRISPSPAADWDFEVPGENRNMKSIVFMAR